MQKTIELKLNAKDIIMMHGRKIYNIEQFVKINEKGDQVFLSLVVPAEYVRTNTFKLTIDVADIPVVRNDSKTPTPIRV
jgi:hypothetical protein